MGEERVRTLMQECVWEARGATGGLASGKQAGRLEAGGRKLVEVNDLQVFKLAEERLLRSRQQKATPRPQQRLGRKERWASGAVTVQARAVSAQRGDGNWDCTEHETEGDETHDRKIGGKQGGIIDGYGHLVLKLHIVVFSSSFSCSSGCSVLGSLSPGRDEAWWKQGTWLLSSKSKPDKGEGPGKWVKQRKVLAGCLEEELLGG